VYEVRSNESTGKDQTEEHKKGKAGDKFADEALEDKIDKQRETSERARCSRLSRNRAQRQQTRSKDRKKAGRAYWRSMCWRFCKLVSSREERGQEDLNEPKSWNC
jgi:hypothetical protein